MGVSHRSTAYQVTPELGTFIRAGGMYVCYGAVAISRDAGADVCDAEAGNGLTEGCEIITTEPGITTEFAALLASVNNMT